MPRHETFTFKLSKSERALQWRVSQILRRPQADMLRFLTWQAAIELGVIDDSQMREGGDDEQE
jgi:hypothetical protein